MMSAALYAAIVVSLVAAIYRTPGIAVASVVCMFGLEVWAQAMVPFFTHYHEFTNYVAGLLVVFGVALVFFRRRSISLDYSTVGWLVLILYFYAFTSLLWTPDFERSIGLWADRAPYMVMILILAPLLINSLSDIKGMSWGVLLLGGVIVILLLTFGQWNGRKIILVGAEQDTGGNPLAVAGMAGYVAFAAMFLPARKPAVLHRVLRWTLLAACLVLAVKSGSRGQSLGILIITVILLLFTMPSKGLRSAFWNTMGIGTLLLVGGWALANYAESTRWTSTAVEEAGSGRWYRVITMFSHWYTSPEVLFFGLGNSAAYDFRLLGYYPHDVPVEILTEQGLIGFGLFLTIICLATRSLIRVYRMVKYDDTNRGVALTLGACFFYTLLLSFKQGSMLGQLFLFLFATMLNKYEKIVATGVILQPGTRLTSWK